MNLRKFYKVYDSPNSRHVWVRDLRGVLWQIAENVILITYYLHDTTKELTITHWKSELYKQCRIIAKQKIEGGNKLKVREKALKHAVYRFDIEDLDWLKSTCHDKKMRDEGIVSSSLDRQWHNYYLQTLRGLYPFLINGDASALESYIKLI